MNYHNITKEDMLNGEGLRVVLWVSGCAHKCKNCHNPITWDVDGGLPFNEAAEAELFEALNKPYISGITFSGGDPLHPANQQEIFRLIKKVKEQTTNKTVWLYTGYKWEDFKTNDAINFVDVFVDGQFVESLKNANLQWVGSSNQRVINVAESLKANHPVLFEV